MKGGERCNGGVEKPEVPAEMIREPGIQGFSLPLLPFFCYFFWASKKSKSQANHQQEYKYSRKALSALTNISKLIAKIKLLKH